MAKTTGISWADSTANFWMGCTKVSPACDHCYAERDWDLRKHRVTWGPKGDRSYVKAGWDLVRRFDRAARGNGGVDPELGRRRRIFINSLSDIGDNHPSILWHREAFELCYANTAVDLLFVTKRPKALLGLIRRHAPHWLEPNGWPAHVWVYVTVEDQTRAYERRDALRAIPAAVRGVSYEPALGPVDWTGWEFVQSIIAGGESGPKARPSHPEWFRTARDFSAANGIAFHFKQWGEWKHAMPKLSGAVGKYCLIPNKFTTGFWSSTIAYCDNYPRMIDAFGSCICEKVGKKAAGRLLDGKTHDAMPTTPKGGAA